MNYLIMMIQQYGVGFVFLNVLALQAGLPVPAYPALMVAGAYAAMGGRPLWQLVAGGLVSALVAGTGRDPTRREKGVRGPGAPCQGVRFPAFCVLPNQSPSLRFRAT